mgnify:CR=1 FL=1
MKNKEKYLEYKKIKNMDKQIEKIEPAKSYVILKIRPDQLRKQEHDDLTDTEEELTEKIKQYQIIIKKIHKKYPDLDLINL